MKKIGKAIRKFIVRICEFNIIISKTTIAALELGEHVDDMLKVNLEKQEKK